TRIHLSIILSARYCILSSQLPALAFITTHQIHSTYTHHWHLFLSLFPSNQFFSYLPVKLAQKVYLTWRQIMIQIAANSESSMRPKRADENGGV
ncbi:hypothetical protein C8J57DRAFT_1339382, partial [Mycena rebaudengoi]